VHCGAADDPRQRIAGDGFFLTDRRNEEEMSTRMQSSSRSMGFYLAFRILGSAESAFRC